MKYTTIKNKKQYFEYCKSLKELVFGDHSEEKLEEIELLTLLIRDWDDRHPMGGEPYDPIQLIKASMDERGLNQTDLARETGVTKGYISEILNYKKELSKTMIRKISNFLKIRQEALNRPYALKRDEAVA